MLTLLNENASTGIDTLKSWLDTVRADLPLAAKLTFGRIGPALSPRPEGVVDLILSIDLTGEHPVRVAHAEK